MSLKGSGAVPILNTSDDRRTVCTKRSRQCKHQKGRKETSLFLVLSEAWGRERTHIFRRFSKNFPFWKTFATVISAIGILTHIWRQLCKNIHNLKFPFSLPMCYVVANLIVTKLCVVCSFRRMPAVFHWRLGTDIELQLQRGVRPAVVQHGLLSLHQDGEELLRHPV